MRLSLLISLTMIAFAANSLLNRVAVDSGAASPAGFAALRVASGALALWLLLLVQGKSLPLVDRRRVIGAVALTVYLVGFSLAYLSLDAGVGALILFGVVQITMFLAAAVMGSPATRRQVVGAVLAFVGLVWIAWPAGTVRIDLAGVVLMAAAGVGWAFYTLEGRREADALSGTAANFLAAFPVVILACWLAGAAFRMTFAGAVLATMSGAITSGLGYALWYRLLPHLAPATAATVQLAVPVLAVIGGVILLGEVVGLRFVLGAIVVLGGIAIALRPGRDR